MLLERAREIARALFINSPHTILLTITVLGVSAETPVEALMIGQLRYSYLRCTHPLRSCSNELSVIAIVVPERRRVHAEAPWESHGYPRVDVVSYYFCHMTTVQLALPSLLCCVKLSNLLIVFTLKDVKPAITHQTYQPIKFEKNILFYY
jgi:hypothetical protein